MNKWLLWVLAGGAGLWVILRARQARAEGPPWWEEEEVPLEEEGVEEVLVDGGAVPPDVFEVGADFSHVAEGADIFAMEQIAAELPAEDVTTLPVIGREVELAKRLALPGGGFVSEDPSRILRDPSASPRPLPFSSGASSFVERRRTPQIKRLLDGGGHPQSIKRVESVPGGSSTIPGGAPRIPLDRPMMGFGGVFGAPAFEVPIFEVPTLPVLSPQRYGPDFTVRPRPYGFPGASVRGW